MKAESKPAQKKYFTVEEANATLPLVSSILRDVTALARALQAKHQSLTRFQEIPRLTRAQQDELRDLVTDFERDQEKMQEYEDELRNLNIELKDYFTGLIDFPCWMNNHEVYLCFRLGEPEVGHWHELDAGFAGRRKLPPSRKN